MEPSISSTSLVKMEGGRLAKPFFVEEMDDDNSVDKRRRGDARKWPTHLLRDDQTETTASEMTSRASVCLSERLEESR